MTPWRHLNLALIWPTPTHAMLTSQATMPNDLTTTKKQFKWRPGAVLGATLLLHFWSSSGPGPFLLEPLAIAAETGTSDYPKEPLMQTDSWRSERFPTLPLLRTPNVEVRIFADAARSCARHVGGDADSLSRTFRSALDLPSSDASRALNHFFPNWRDDVGARHVVVLVNDFRQDLLTYRSYYQASPDDPNGGLIWIDCSERTTRAAQSILAHELTHALLDPAGVPIWFQEGAAQVIEEAAKGKEPVERRIPALRRARVMPLLIQEHALVDEASYGLTFLFMKYMLRHFKQDLFLKAVTLDPLPPGGSCIDSLGDLAKIACRGKAWLQLQSGTPPLLIDQMNEEFIAQDFFSKLLDPSHDVSGDLERWPGFIPGIRIR